MVHGACVGFSAACLQGMCFLSSPLSEAPCPLEIPNSLRSEVTPSLSCRPSCWRRWTRSLVSAPWWRKSSSRGGR